MNEVTYLGPEVEKGRPIEKIALLIVLAMVALATWPLLGAKLAIGALTAIALSATGLLFGANTVTYELPVTGVTPPTALQSSNQQAVSAIITGDGAATSFTVTHNWGLSAALIAKGFPWVNLEPLLVGYYTANPFASSKAGGNAVVFTCVAFSTAAIRVTLLRPWSGIA